MCSRDATPHGDSVTLARPTDVTRRLLFRRDFGGFTGGHGKVYDYFKHACAHPGWCARVHMTSTSTWSDNPWASDPGALTPVFEPAHADALFLGGMDWQHYPHDVDARPVINLIQHVRHADSAQPLSDFLARRAVRICVSQPVADAILATGRVRGPVHVVEASLNLPRATTTPIARSGIFIDAIKQPEMGQRIAQALAGHGEITLSTQRLPRQSYANALAGASIAVLLPHATEGFYLPALEAMASGCAVVVPDCIGNRAYLDPGCNALVPDGEADCIDAVKRLVEDPELRARLKAAGMRTAAGFGPARERAAFHRILDALDTLWLQA